MERQGALSRIDEAYRRAVNELPDVFSALNADLLRPDTELAFVVVLAIWAGVDLPQLGGMIQGAISRGQQAANLGAAGEALIRSARLSADAENEAALAAASAGLGKALVQVGPARLTALLHGDSFSQLRGVLAGKRALLDLSGELWTASSAPKVPATPATASAMSGSVLWWAIGAATALGTVLIVISRAPRRAR